MRWPRIPWDLIASNMHYALIGVGVFLASVGFIIALFTNQTVIATNEAVRADQKLLRELQAEHVRGAQITQATIERLERFIRAELAVSIRKQDRARETQFRQLLADIQRLRFTVEDSSGDTVIIRPQPTATKTVTVGPGRGRKPSP